MLVTRAQVLVTNRPREMYIMMSIDNASTAMMVVHRSTWHGTGSKTNIQRLLWFLALEFCVDLTPITVCSFWALQLSKCTLGTCDIFALNWLLRHQKSISFKILSAGCCRHTPGCGSNEPSRKSSVPTKCKYRQSQYSPVPTTWTASPTSHCN